MFANLRLVPNTVIACCLGSVKGVMEYNTVTNDAIAAPLMTDLGSAGETALLYIALCFGVFCLMDLFKSYNPFHGRV